ncbi:hypothetical protein CBR_g50719 [Chara braunii]|uniref:CCHC-type domain-containing protein n=1 Tax=Chara braunii TaxID=69332 RepID=A0A388K5N2_CHABU|nr:hypothetical protein CBR_g50719 [Chara braunii]|eukprot:GBG65357.1 hypothetical protein CBR_g50719 [Chara braunii]
MPEEMADGGRKLVTLDDLIDALDKRERAPSNVPKVETFHFKGDRVSDWLDLTEQALVGLSDEVKLQRVLRKYRLGDGLLTMADLEAMNKEDFSTIGAFVHEFKKRARKVHGISEEAQCATFLGLLTGSEATELTKYGEGSERLTWATIDKGVEEGSLDQVEQHQMRLQRRKWKERDATASGTPGVKRIVTDVLAALGYDSEAELQKRVVVVAQGRASGAHAGHMVPYSGPSASMGPPSYPATQSQPVAQPPPSQQASQASVAGGGDQGQGGQDNGGRGQGGRGGGGRGRGGNGGGHGGGWNGQGGQNQGGQGSQGGGQGYGRPRFDWRNATCWHCGEVGHTVRFCQQRRDDEKAGLISTCMDGDIYDWWGTHIDPKTPGGIRQEALRRATAGPPAAPAMFRIWQERQDPGVRVEEIVDENEKVTQRLKAGTIKEEPTVVESDEEAQEVVRESASTILERMEGLLAKVGRYQERLRAMCGKAREWEMSLPEVMLYGSGLESSSGPQGCPSVATAGTGPRSGMTFRPPTSHGRVPQAAQTRGQSKATTSQGPCQAPSRAPLRKDSEPERRKEVVEVQEEEDEGDDEEDERLRQEEDRRAEQRVKKRGAQGGAEPSLHDGVPKRKKYAVRLEEGFDVERMVDKLLECHNDLMNLKDILASAPRLRGELKERLSINRESKGANVLLRHAEVDHPILLGRSFLCRTETLVFNRHEGTMILALSDPACGNYEIIKCRNTGPGSARNRLNLGSFTFEESEYARRRLREEQEGEGAGEVLSLSLNDMNKAMEVVAAHDMADPVAIKALRKQAGPYRINNENEEGLIIGESGFLSPQERTLMVETMRRRHCTYAFNDDERGRLDVDKIPMIRIHTVPHESWNLRGARYPNPDEEKKVVDYLDGKMRTYVADYSSGPYASPWFCFIKPNRTLRWVQDLQRLNAVTLRDARGLPNKDALSESCAGRPIISLIDLDSGYDQFSMYPPDRPVTAMHTPRGLIHMNVAPQGWTNAVAMVQRHMIRAMLMVSPHITQPYIDDLAVKGLKEKEEGLVMPGVRRFVWKHVQDIDQVLRLLEEHNLTASGPKSKHCMREAMILGFVCNKKGRRPDVKKTDKILEWSVPFQSITDVRSFLGTCGFWRSFVKDFATKTEHLRKLVHQDQEWVWGEDQEKAVERMKREFKEGGLVLGAPNYEATEEKPFNVETDVGPTALGGVLIQADADGKERPLRSDFSKAVMQRGGRDTRPRQGLQRMAGGGEQHGLPRRELTPEFDDDNIELFLDVYRDHAAQKGWCRAGWRLLSVKDAIVEVEELTGCYWLRNCCPESGCSLSVVGGGYD